MRKIFILFIIIITTICATFILTNQVESKNTIFNEEPFVIVTLPDTQFYSESYPDIFTNQTKWIVNNKDNLNIKFVIHLGDLVNNPRNITKWERANKSMSILDGQIPWMIAVGNHDIYETNGNFYFDNYFKYIVSDESHSWFNEICIPGTCPIQLKRNNYVLMNLKGFKLGIFCSTFYPSQIHGDLLEKIISENPDYNFIIAAHDFVKENKLTTNGEIIWDEILRHQDNVILIVSGHTPKPTESNFQMKNIKVFGLENNKTTYAILSNYQSLENGGNGYLRYYKFIPAENRIEAYTYSPYINEFGTQFNMSNLGGYSQL